MPNVSIFTSLLRINTLLKKHSQLMKQRQENLNNNFNNDLCLTTKFRQHIENIISQMTYERQVTEQWIEKHQQIWTLCTILISHIKKQQQTLLEMSVRRHSLIIFIGYRRFLGNCSQTYLQKLYMKIDQNDFLDPISEKQGGYYQACSDTFILNSLIEMSAPKHVKFLDEYVYLYTGSPTQYDISYFLYADLMASSLRIYLPLENLNEKAVRGSSVGDSQQKIKQIQKLKRR